MKKIIIPIAALCLISACNSGGSDSNDNGSTPIPPATEVSIEEFQEISAIAADEHIAVKTSPEHPDVIIKKDLTVTGRLTIR